MAISDHSLIHASIRLTRKQPPTKIIRTSNYKNINDSYFEQDISFAPFQVASLFDDPDDKLWAWNKLFLDVCDQHTPLKDVKVRSSSEAPPPRKATALKQQAVVGPVKAESGHLVVKDDEKARLMNTYFALVGEKLALDPLPSITRSLSSDSVTEMKIVPSLSEVNLSEVGVLQ